MCLASASASGVGLIIYASAVDGRSASGIVEWEESVWTASRLAPPSPSKFWLAKNRSWSSSAPVALSFAGRAMQK